MIAKFITAGAGGLLCCLALAACGSSSTGGQQKATSAGGPAAQGGGSPPGSPNVLSAETQSTKTGDIPDTQAFVTFQGSGARFSMKYPEGWAQSGGANDVTFRDKNNVVHIVIAHGGPATPAQASAQLEK